MEIGALYRIDLHDPTNPIVTKLDMETKERLRSYELEEPQVDNIVGLALSYDGCRPVEYVRIDPQYPDGPFPPALNLKLLPVPDLKPWERLELGAALLSKENYRCCAVQGDLMFRSICKVGVGCYRLEHLDDESARYVRMGVAKYSKSENYVNDYFQTILIENRKAYVLQNNRMTVYDLPCPKPPKRIAYYASRGEIFFRDMCLLSNGKLMLLGEKFHIVDVANRP